MLTVVIAFIAFQSWVSTMSRLTVPLYSVFSHLVLSHYTLLVTNHNEARWFSGSVSMKLRYRLFTTPTRTRQDCLVLSVSAA